MLRRYATIEPTIWTSETGREWRRLGPTHQVLALYLITNPHASGYGLYYLPLVIMAEETGITRHSCLKVLEVFAAQNYALYDETTEWVWVINMAARQLGLTSVPNANEPRIVGLRKWYATCPRNPFLGPFFELYHDLFSMEVKREGGVAKLAHGSDAPVPSNGTPRSRAAALFEEWWPHYPKPSGKKAALGEWLKIQPLPDDAFTARCIHAVERQKLSATWVKEGGRFIPDPERWLKKGRWEDEAADLPLLSDADAQRVSTLSQWNPREDDDDDQ